MFPHLRTILPDLKQFFERAYICPPPSTLQQQVNMRQLEADPFFTIFYQETEMQIGERFKRLYRLAAESSPEQQILHLCYLDRLAFAMETRYHDGILADMTSLCLSDVPVIFQRSEPAWQTHPQNYREIENFVTLAGRHLFGRDLDYAWCHLSASAGQLREIMPLVVNPDLSMVAEIVCHLQRFGIQTRDVDWLAWEDPFILERDAAELKRQRELDPLETEKRLSYVVRMMDTLKRISAESRQRTAPGSPAS